MGVLLANVAGVWEPVIVPVGPAGVAAVVAGPDTTVDATDPANPVVVTLPVNEVTISPTAPTDTSKLWGTAGGDQAFATRYGWLETANPGVPTADFVFNAKVRVDNQKPAGTASAAQWLVSHNNTAGTVNGFTLNYTPSLYGPTVGDGSVAMRCGLGSCSWRIPYAAWTVGVDVWLRVNVPVAAKVATLQWSTDGVTYTAPMNSTTSAQPLLPVDPGAPLVVGSGFGFSTISTVPRISWRGLVYWAQVALFATPATPLWRADASELATPYETAYPDPRGRDWTIRPAGLRLPDPASLYVRNGAAWDRIGASTAALDRIDAMQIKVDRNPLGIVAVGSFTFGDNVYLTAGAALTNPLALVAVANRWYRFCISFRAAISDNTAGASLHLYRDGVYITDRHQQMINGLYQQMTTSFMIQSPNSGNYTVIWNQSPATVYGFSIYGHWYIEDLGSAL